MIYGVGDIKKEDQIFIEDIFKKHDLPFKFSHFDQLKNERVISFDKAISRKLTEEGIKFYNWDLLFSVLGPNDRSGEFVNKLEERIKILKSILSLKSKPVGEELHGSIRVNNLANSTKFYTWLFGVEPKEWTHRYVTFKREDTAFNFVLLVADGKELHHDTLYHLGMGVRSKDEVVQFYHSAVENGFHIEKPPRTTWRGTPLHEMWLKDPDGTLIEVYARLSKNELEQMPENKEPWDLV